MRLLLAPATSGAQLARRPLPSVWNRLLTIADRLDDEVLGPPPWDEELTSSGRLAAVAPYPERYTRELAGMIDACPGRDRRNGLRRYIRSGSWRITVARARGPADLQDLERRVARLHAMTLQDRADALQNRAGRLRRPSKEPDPQLPAPAQILRALGLPEDGSVPGLDLHLIQRLPCSVLGLDEAHLEPLGLDNKTPLRASLRAAGAITRDPSHPGNRKAQTASAELLVAWKFFEDEERWLALADLRPPSWTEVHMALGLLFERGVAETPYVRVLSRHRGLRGRLIGAMAARPLRQEYEAPLPPSVSKESYRKHGPIPGIREARRPIIDLPATAPGLLEIKGIGPKSVDTLRDIVLEYLRHRRYGPSLRHRDFQWEQAATPPPPGHEDLSAGLDELAALYGE